MTRQRVLEESKAPASSASFAGDGCFHCGERCPDDRFAQEGKLFCCFGCQTVFSLLRENGLEQFYELNAKPGVRIRGESVAA